MEINQKQNDRISIMIGLSLLSIFVLFYYCSQENINSKLDSCSIVTIAYPQKFVPQSNLYYYFKLNNVKIEDGYNVPFNNMGKFFRSSNLMKERFWIKVYCNDYHVNSIYWDAKVPDTLQFIPKNGWSKIPYGLGDN